MGYLKWNSSIVKIIKLQLKLNRAIAKNWIQLINDFDTNTALYLFPFWGYFSLHVDTLENLEMKSLSDCTVELYIASRRYN